jgi:hypothetical protein
MHDHAGLTHRKLFDNWVKSMMNVGAKDLVALNQEPVHAKILFDKMMRDIGSGGGSHGDPLTLASYAIGYNLAIEYLADFEKRWMLESFRKMDAKFMAAQGCQVDWTFLEVRLQTPLKALNHTCRCFLGGKAKRSRYSLDPIPTK